MPAPLWKDTADLQRRLRAVEPAVRLVSERRVRRVLHLLHEAGDERVLNPTLPVWVAADFLRESDAVPDETLDGAAGDVLLISEPDDRHVRWTDDAAVLRHYWRLLVRAAVQREVARRVGAAEAGRRLAALPPDVLAEVRFVLESDHVVRRHAPASELFPAFAAVVAELAVFDPDRLHDVFPSAPPADDPFAALGTGIDGRGLADRLRPAGAEPVAEAGEPAAVDRDEPRPAVDVDEEAAESEREARLGNYVRAAVRRRRAARAAAGEEKRRLEQAARSAIRNGLVKGLARVLDLDADRAEEWFRAVWPFVGAAAAGTWPHAAKALYDLQKLAADLRDRQFAVAPVEWLTSLGRHFLRRPLDRARDVQLHARLGRVEKHVLRAEVPEADRDRLLALLHEHMAAAEARIRRDLGPVIRGVFDQVGLVPVNLPERVARDKLVAELLDRVCERGYLRLGDLRDAIARNQLKLPDLAGPGEFARGDALLRADARLADELFGVYHRGEVYLRALQRFSSVFFGTPVGRAITLYLALPFGGAFLTLMFLEELRHIGGAAVGFVSKILAPRPAAELGEAGLVFDEESGEVFWFDPREAAQIAGKAVTAAEPGAHGHSGLTAWPTVVGFGVFLLLVFHAPAFRLAVLAVGKGAWRMLRLVLWDVPRAVATSPAVRALWRNPAARFLGRVFGPAVVATAVLVVVMAALGASTVRIVRWSAVVFGLVAAAANTPLGRGIADRLAEGASDAWRVVRVNLLPGLVGWFLWVFQELLGAIDRVLYTVDEKLRYREEASRPSVALKVALTLLWFPIAYVVRFAFYLLIEPQVNPIKHFPVVTVSHKVLLPLVISPDPQAVPSAFGEVLVSQLGLAVGQANFWAFWIIAAVPGVFGFAAWELLANWRLYAANRPERLKPVPIGHHGETGRGLLRPGFHSGTVPKLYRKLRAGWLDGGARPAEQAGKAHHELHHIETAIRRQVEREVFPLWAAARPTAAIAPAVAGVHLGCQHVRVEVGFEGSRGEPACVVWRNGPDGITGEVVGLGAAAEPSAEQQAVIRTVLEGFLALAAARRGREMTWCEWVEYWSKRESK